MPTLSNPGLQLKLVAGTPNVEVTGTVNVNFSPTEETLIGLLSLKYRLGCNIRGSDSGLTGSDDSLFSISTKTINADGTYTFKRTVNRNSLDEDWVGDDEVYARYSCTPPTDSGLVLSSATPVNSPVVVGSF